MEQVDVEVARWAVGPGLSVIADVTEALDAGEDVLAVGTRLRRSVTAPRAAFAVTAAVARRRARDAGVPGAADLVLTREAGEQASHPSVAAWRAQRADHVASLAGADGPLVDLCAGTGGDAVALAATGRPVVAVERDPGRAVLLAHRASVLGVDVEVVVGDALDPPVSVSGRVVHADPDRRDPRGNRARTLATHGPPVDLLLEVIGARGAAAGLVTVAAGTSWDDDGLPPDAGVSFVEHDGRLSEAVVEVGAAATARARAVRAPDGPVLERGDRGALLPVEDVRAHLVVPSPALVRARLHDAEGARVGATRLARRRALLSADHPVGSPWLSSEEVLVVLPARVRALRAWLGSDQARSAGAEDGGVELLTHGIDEDPARFLRSAGATTGPHGVRVHLVRRDDDAVAIVTRTSHGPPPTARRRPGGGPATSARADGATRSRGTVGGTRSRTTRDDPRTARRRCTVTELATADPDVQGNRSCTRCDGTQELVASGHGMGSYRCTTCTMHVGFDLSGEPVEFLLDRGTPARYTRDVFGDRLLVDERRLRA